MDMYELGLMCFVILCLSVSGTLAFVDYCFYCMRTMEQIYRQQVIDILHDLKPYGTLPQIVGLLDLVHGHKLSLYHVTDIIDQLQRDGIVVCSGARFTVEPGGEKTTYYYMVKDGYRGPA